MRYLPIGRVGDICRGQDCRWLLRQAGEKRVEPGLEFGWFEYGAHEHSFGERGRKEVGAGWFVVGGIVDIAQEETKGAHFDLI